MQNQMEVLKMDIEKKDPTCEAETSAEDFRIRLNNPMLYDRLYTLSAEYSVCVELLVNTAVKRLIQDIDFVRDLRAGKIETE